MGNVNCVSCTAPQKKSNKEVSPIKKRSSLYLSKKLSEGLEENQVNASKFKYWGSTSKQSFNVYF